VTSGSGPGYDFMRRLGKGDPPLLVVFGPGLSDGPILSNAYGHQDLADFVARAKTTKK
jgi:hypothetical protein